MSTTQTEEKTQSHHDDVASGHEADDAKPQHQAQKKQPLKKKPTQQLPNKKKPPPAPPPAEPASEDEGDYESEADEAPEQSTTGAVQQASAVHKRFTKDMAKTPFPGRKKMASEVIGDQNMKEMDEKREKEKDDKQSLRIKISLDLDVEVHLSARVKGDITIGLL